MFETRIPIRVRYAETDQMNVVYHANYATYFEVARTESIRQLGFTYREMEDMGIEMPVVEIKMKYLRSARYDDLITVRTQLRELPQQHVVTFHQDIFNAAGKLITSGFVTLFFLDRATRRRSRMPEILRSKLLPYFEESESSLPAV
ncbi:MAG: acyl-CoA thioesterase [Chitinophagaceae bacterium]